MPKIDLNADLGESFGAWTMGNDEDMLDIVTSANIACGFHAGDPAGIWATVKAAAQRGVSIGAHVAYPDIVGFGRRDMDIAPADLTADVLYQIGAIAGMAKAAGTRVSYVKPHGALYNRIAHDPVQGQAVVDAIARFDGDLALMGLAGTPILGQARKAGLVAVAEAFADRAYRPDGQLVSRREPGAVLHDKDEITARMEQLVTTGTVTAADGSTIAIDAQSICVHGDSPGAVAIARAIRSHFQGKGIAIQGFCTAA